MSGNRLMAALYDRSLASTERAGLKEMRRALVGTARGRTLELGAGTGLNLGHYGPEVTSLVLSEPDQHMAAKLREKLAASPPHVPDVTVSSASAEGLPFEDQSFDTVVATLVLCTVPDPDRAVAEARRVLVAGGRLLFIEHVRAQTPRLARWQDRLERPWGWIAGGCHPNRATAETLAASGFWLERLEGGELPKAPAFVRPLISGVACRPEPVRPD